MSKQKPKKIFDFSFFVLFSFALIVFFALLFLNIFLFNKYDQLENQQKLSNFPGGQQKKDELQENIKNNKNEIENLNQQLTNKNNEIQQLKNKITQLEQEKNNLNQQITNKNNEITQLNIKMTEKEQEKNNLNQELTDKNNKIQELKDRIETLQNNIIRNSNYLYQLTQKEEQFQNQLIKAQTLQNVNQNLNNISSTVDNLEKDRLINEINQQLIQLQVATAQQKTINNLSQQLINRNDDITQLNIIITQLEQEKNNLNQQLTDKNNEIIQLKNEIERLKNKQQIIFPLFTAEPYNTYTNEQGDTIREYSITTTLKPTVKDYHGRTNFLETKELLKYFNFVYINSFFSFKENIDLKNYKTSKKDGGWFDTSKDYQFLLTNQPEIHPNILKYDFEDGKRNIFIKKINEDDLTQQEKNDIQPYLSRIDNLNNELKCYLNDSTQIDEIKISVGKGIENKYPYFRFRTKNLELKLTDEAIKWNQEQIDTIFKINKK